MKTPGSKASDDGLGTFTSLKVNETSRATSKVRSRVSSGWRSFSGWSRSTASVALVAEARRFDAGPSAGATGSTDRIEGYGRPLGVEMESLIEIARDLTLFLIAFLVGWLVCGLFN